VNECAFADLPGSSVMLQVMMLLNVSFRFCFILKCSWIRFWF